MHTNKRQVHPHATVGLLSVYVLKERTVRGVLVFKAFSARGRRYEGESVKLEKKRTKTNYL